MSLLLFFMPTVFVGVMAEALTEALAAHRKPKAPRGGSLNWFNPKNRHFNA